MTHLKLCLHFVKIAARNLTRHWRRSVAAILSIASGFAALNLFEGYIADAENIFDVTYSQRLMYGDVLIHRDDAFQSGLWDDGSHQMSPVQQRELEALLAEAGRTDIYVRFLNVFGLASNGSTTTTFTGYGYDWESGRKMRQPIWEWNTLAGRPLGASTDAIALGRGLGRILDCNVTERLAALEPVGGYKAVERPFNCRSNTVQLTVTSDSGQMNATSVQVQGLIDAVYTEFDNRAVVMSLDKAQALLNTDGVSFFSVRVKDHDEVDAFVSELNAKFTARGLPLVATPWKTHAYGDIYVRSMNFLGVFRTFTLLVVLTIVALSVLSTLIRLVQERTREIGTLRSLGFRNSHIMSLFLIEVFLLATLGNAVGALAAILGAGIMNAARLTYKIGILSEEVPFHITLPLAHFLVGAAALTGIAWLTTLLATRRALQMKIPDSLSRH